MVDGRWQRCVRHRGAEAIGFLQGLFNESNRRILFVCGGGFDPRCDFVCKNIAAACSDRAVVAVIREERPQAIPS